MEKEILNELKNQIYEAEGLVELLALRPEKDKDLLPLIRSRLDLARALTAEETDKGGHGQENGTGDLIETEDMIEADEVDVPDEAANWDHVIAPVEVNEAPAVVAPQPLRDPMKFCLNDRFRFRRALFGGDDAEFERALIIFASAQSLGEAEDYLFETLALDPTDEDVMDFMEILKTYFGQ